MNAVCCPFNHCSERIPVMHYRNNIIANRAVHTNIFYVDCLKDSDCNNHGTCRLWGRRGCECTAGYIGPNCEIKGGE